MGHRVRQLQEQLASSQLAMCIADLQGQHNTFGDEISGDALQTRHSNSAEIPSPTHSAQETSQALAWLRLAMASWRCWSVGRASKRAAKQERWRERWLHRYKRRRWGGWLGRVLRGWWMFVLHKQVRTSAASASKARRSARNNAVNKGVVRLRAQRPRQRIECRCYSGARLLLCRGHFLHHKDGQHNLWNGQHNNTGSKRAAAPRPHSAHDRHARSA